MLDTALAVQDVTYWYPGGSVVLAGAGLTVAAGEVVVVRGANGSGKTTLLRLAAGIHRPRRGTVRSADPIGYQPQTGEEPPPRLSAAAWLTLMERISRPPDGSRPAELLAALGGEPGRQLSALSRGTVSKVLLAGALAGQPALVLLDEPFAALDAGARAAAASLIRAAAATGAGVLLSDHHGAGDLVATRIVRISDATIVAEAAPSGGPRWKIILRAPDGQPRELLVPVAHRDELLLEALKRGEEVCHVEELR